MISLRKAPKLPSSLTNEIKMRWIPECYPGFIEQGGPLRFTQIPVHPLKATQVKVSSNPECKITPLLEDCFMNNPKA